MKRVKPQKWIEGVAPDDAVIEVALRSLDNRLGAVLTYLPLAATAGEKNTECVHQLRVWTRRAASTLNLYRQQIPHRKYVRLAKRLKLIRQAANDARDCDVLIEHLKKRSGPAVKLWRETLAGERDDAHQAVVEVYEHLAQHDRLVRRVEKLRRKMRRVARKAHSANAKPFAEWAPTQLRPVVEQFFAAVPTDKTDAVALHQFRISGKELRYAMELLDCAFEGRFRTGLYPAIEAMQERLGAINDLATALAWLQNKLDLTDDTAQAALWHKLLAGEQLKLARAQAGFLEVVYAAHVAQVTM